MAGGASEDGGSKGRRGATCRLFVRRLGESGFIEMMMNSFLVAANRRGAPYNLPFETSRGNAEARCVVARAAGFGIRQIMRPSDGCLARSSLTNVHSPLMCSTVPSMPSVSVSSVFV